MMLVSLSGSELYVPVKESEPIEYVDHITEDDASHSTDTDKRKITK